VFCEGHDFLVPEAFALQLIIVAVLQYRRGGYPQCLLLTEGIPHTVVEDLADVVNHAVEHPLDVYLDPAS